MFLPLQSLQAREKGTLPTELTFVLDCASQRQKIDLLNLVNDKDPTDTDAFGL